MSYERKEVYGIDEVLSKRLSPELEKGSETEVEFDGDRMYMNSLRYEVFDVKGTACCSCGVEGRYFAKERDKKAKRYHFNLYGVDDNGKEVMLTKARIVPKNNDVVDSVENYQTMCRACHHKKAKPVSSSMEESKS